LSSKEHSERKNDTNPRELNFLSTFQNDQHNKHSFPPTVDASRETKDDLNNVNEDTEDTLLTDSTFCSSFDKPVGHDYENVDYKGKQDYENHKFLFKPVSGNDNAQTGFQRHTDQETEHVHDQPNQSSSKITKEKHVHAESNVYSMLNEHEPHSKGDKDQSSSNIYAPHLSSGYLVPVDSRSSGTDKTHAPKNGQQDVSKIETGHSVVCQSISSMNSPLYENYPSLPTSPAVKDETTTRDDERILSSNLCTYTNTNLSSPDELFYAVSPTRTSDPRFDFHTGQTGYNLLHQNMHRSPSLGFNPHSDNIHYNPSAFHNVQPGYFVASGFSDSYVVAHNNFGVNSTVTPQMSSASQVFMKEEFEQHLDMEARKIHLVAALHIQKNARMFLARRKFLIMHRKTKLIQAVIRMHLAR
jgi:hypothetical protein